MPQVLRWPPDDPGAVVKRCRRAIHRGDLLVLPTEAGYVLAANGLDAAAVGRLAAVRAGDLSPLPVVAVRGPDDAGDWVPDPGTIGRRLVQRCWPGPVVLTFASGAKAGAATRLPDGVLRTVAPGWIIGLFAPYHPAVRALLDDLSVPLVLGEVTVDGKLAATCDATFTAIGEVGPVAVDGGPVASNRPATVIEVRGDRWTVRREGAVPTQDVARLAARMIVFVCTGNTCRSPLAEALCKRLLADRLGCGTDELPDRGFAVTSAGLAAMRGEPAAAEAVAIAAELGADLTGHCSRPATPELLAHADDVIGMTVGHLHALAAYTGAGGYGRLLCGDADLSDPIGGDRAVYQACAGTIWQHLQRLVDEFLDR